MATAEHRARRVLILDASEESRLVLGELLGRSGVEATLAGHPAAAIKALDGQAIDSLVLDAEGLSDREIDLVLERCVRSHTAIVAIGTSRLESRGVEAAVVRKPYHYRELIHKIWASLGSVGTQARAAA